MKNGSRKEKQANQESLVFLFGDIICVCVCLPDCYDDTRIRHMYILFTQVEKTSSNQLN